MSLPTDALREKIANTFAAYEPNLIGERRDVFMNAILALLPAPPLLVMRDDGTATAFLPSRNDVIEECVKALEAREDELRFNTSLAPWFLRALRNEVRTGIKRIRTLKDPT